MAATVLQSLLVGILDELGSLNLPCIQAVFCFNSEKRKLMNTMSMIHAKLSDAEEQQKTSRIGEDWLEELQIILNEAEDLVEELSLEAQQQADSNRNMADKVLSFISTLPFYIVTASKMKNISERLNDVATDTTMFHPGRQVVGLKDKNEEQQETHAFVPENKVIGREREKRVIIDLLMRSGDAENVSIIPIMGIGGVGKSTLARLVFNDDFVKGHFDLSMWVWVSPVFDVKTLVKKILEAVTHRECPNLGMDLLQLRLREELNARRYLLVLDDVWNNNRERWIELENLLMGGARGSTILVTTRNWEVASIMGTTTPHVVNALSKEDSWDLFMQLASKSGQMEENPSLLAVKREIVEKSEGIPLAIRAVAGLFCLLTVGEWQYVVNQLWEQAQDDHILPILRLSYAQLPSNLKKCFAYCSLFPKGSELEKATLIQLWMAQGFILQSKNRHMEDIGEQYFKELWNRSFFKETKRDAYGNIINCKMYDLMHDLAKAVAGCEYSIVSEDAVNISKRLVHASVDVSYPPVLNARNLRTYLRPGIHRWTTIYDLKLALTFKSLRVLYLGRFLGRGSSAVLNSIRELKHLRYLDLSESDIETLPDSVCELYNLQTLKLNYCESLTELPRDIKKLVSLRHLENHGCDKLGGMPSGFGHLTSIRTLPIFVLGSDGLSELKGLNNLRGELWIKNLENARNAISESREAHLIEKYLQTLTLHWRMLRDSGYEDTALLEGLQPNPNLKQLRICGYGSVWFPSWVVDMGMSLPCLVAITLEDCPSCECFPLLSQLPYLKILKLSNLRSLVCIGSYISDSSSSSSSFESNIPSGAGEWFPSLQEVYLIQLPKLKKWTREVVVVDDSGKAETEVVAEQTKPLIWLRSLVKLTIEDCPELSSMPLHPHVEELNLHNVSTSLIQSMMVSATISPMKSTSSLLPSYTFTDLKSLQISCCSNLVSLPEGCWENLTSVERLLIEDCPELASLTQETHHLTSKELDLSEDYYTPRLKRLYSLQLSGLPKLVSLPKVLQHATELKDVQIRDCPGLMTLPDWFSNLYALQRLTIECCPYLSETCQKESGQKESGEDWKKIAHIPRIYIDGELLTI